MRTGLLRDDRYLEHRMAGYHVEIPERLEAVHAALDAGLPFPLEPIAARPALPEEVLRVHTESYFERVRRTAHHDHVMLDPDTSTCPRSFDTAMLAVGGVIEACDAILSGRTDNALALVRPPGHHAEADRARGFCIFNNAAAAAEHLIQSRKWGRVLLADWDLHHGNGSQHSFESRTDVLYFSCHRFPFYPGTGHWTEIGRGEGEGYTMNFPLSSGKGDSDYRFLMRQVLAPVCRQYAPDFIVVSAGFDISSEDPLGGMRVSDGGFAAITQELVDMARENCGGRMLVILEGGYSHGALSRGVVRVLGQLAGADPDPGIPAEASAALREEIRPALEIHRHRWKDI